MAFQVHGIGSWPVIKGPCVKTTRSIVLCTSLKKELTKPPATTTRMKSTVLILLCLTHLFSLMVKETDCISGKTMNSTPKPEKVITIFLLL